MLDRNTLRNLVEQANQISSPEPTNLNEGVAETILQQLGGNKFIVMTGAKNFIKSNNGNTLGFKLPKNAKDGINYVEVTLAPTDTYILNFRKVAVNRKTGEVTNKMVRAYPMVYADQLREIFTRVTGLHTSL